MAEYIRILPPEEAYRELETTSRTHAAERARREAPPRDPARDPRTPSEALRAKYGAGSERPVSTLRRSMEAVARPIGPRVEHGAPALSPMPPAAPPRHRPNEHESEQLNAMRRSGQPVELRLRGGSAVVGRLLHFDQYSLIVELDGQPSVVFKHAVDLVKPVR